MTTEVLTIEENGKLILMPLLRNDVTPDDQTILGVLEDVAVRVGEDCWKLKESGQF